MYYFYRRQKRHDNRDRSNTQASRRTGAEQGRQGIVSRINTEGLQRRVRGRTRIKVGGGREPREEWEGHRCTELPCRSPGGDRSIPNFELEYQYRRSSHDRRQHHQHSDRSLAWTHSYSSRSILCTTNTAGSEAEGRESDQEQGQEQEHTTDWQSFGVLEQKPECQFESCYTNGAHTAENLPLQTEIKTTDGLPWNANTTPPRMKEAKRSSWSSCSFKNSGMAKWSDTTAIKSL